ncbi:hypothetical protein NP493_1703g00012 [Ridgeia piscesae]|uniref:Uncharacterized protein n=1 Tax=Ridgeia piscesae TaxID=27915 RepID=A0AAD9JVJ9_RIDPI|nr:hypothetical protein NP493_1703g00012 [Ridgeia piscesae]
MHLIQFITVHMCGYSYFKCIKRSLDCCQSSFAKILDRTNKIRKLVNRHAVVCRFNVCVIFTIPDNQNNTLHSQSLRHDFVLPVLLGYALVHVHIRNTEFLELFGSFSTCSNEYYVFIHNIS